MDVSHKIAAAIAKNLEASLNDLIDVDFRCGDDGPVISDVDYPTGTNEVLLRTGTDQAWVVEVHYIGDPIPEHQAGVNEIKRSRETYEECLNIISVASLIAEAEGRDVTEAIHSIKTKVFTSYQTACWNRWRISGNANSAELGVVEDLGLA